MNEFSMIEKYFLPLTQGRAEALSLKDDAAIFSIPKNQELVVSSDTLGAGTHFLANENPAFIAHKALRVNLSDLAAMGAKPYAYQLCIAFPKKPSEQWIKEFTTALLKDQKQFGIFCSGGDTTVTKGALTISITAFGLVPKNKAIKRSGARPGDTLVITGEVGKALAGLRILQNKIKLPLPEGGGRGRVYGGKNLSTLNPHLNPPPQGEEMYRACIDAYQKPTPHTAIADIIRRYASAAIDISDGLVADAGHIANASNCGVEIHLDRMQFSQTLITPLQAITGGDDYELALAVPQKNLRPLLQALSRQNLKPQIIGSFVKVPKTVKVFNKNKPLSLKKSGWKHF